MVFVKQTVQMQTPTIPATFKKRKGSIILEKSVLKWKEENEDKISIAIPFVQIERQLIHKNAVQTQCRTLITLLMARLANKVDPSKPKYLIKVVLKAQDASAGEQQVSFQFNSEADREKVISVIQDQVGRNQAMSASAATLPDGPVLSEQEIKARVTLLDSNPEWKKLFLDLVIKRKTLSEEEFWASRKDILEQQQQLSNQKRGTASALLADIKPTDSDGSEIKFTVNADIIHSTFTLYPGVHKAYLDLVPDKLSEKLFWTKWFSSKYFHKSRVNQAKSQKEQDIFEGYMTQIENDTNPHPENLIFEAKNKLLDLTRTFDDHLETGNKPDTTMQAGRVKESLPLIRKFNRHSSLILHGNSHIQTNPSSKKQKVSHSFSQSFQKETEMIDLEVQQKPLVIPLTIQDPSKYFDQRNNVSSPSHRSLSPKKSRPGSNITTNLSKITLESLLSKSAIRVISSKNYHRSFAGVSISERLYEECKSLHASTTELLRHFWASILATQGQTLDPSTTAVYTSKLQRITTALLQVQTRLKSFEDEIHVPADLHQCQGLLENMEKCIEKALNRYQN